MATSLKSLVFLVFLLLGKALYSQSLSKQVGHPYYFLGLGSGTSSDFRNNTNFLVGLSSYGFAGLSKFELGLAYATKNEVYLERDPLSDEEKTSYKLKYLFIPFVLHRNLWSDAVNQVTIGVGNVFMRPFGYEREIIFKDGTKTDWEKLPVLYQLGSALRVGSRYSRFLSEKFLLFAEFNVQFKYRLDYARVSGTFTNPLGKDRVSIATQIGLEWNFGKKGNAFYRRP